MKVKVTSIGEPTPKGNVAITLSKDLDSEFGTLAKGDNYHIAVSADSVKVALNQELDLDMDNTWAIDIRPYTIPDGVDAGKEVDVKWLVRR